MASLPTIGENIGLHLTQYLNNSNQLQDILTSVEQYSKANETIDDVNRLPFRYTVKLNFTELVEISNSLVEFLISEPHMFNKLLNDAVCCAISIMTTIEIESDYVFSSSIINLPVWPSTVASPKKPKRGLFVLRGVLVALTTPTKYLRSTVFRCPIEGCDNYSKVLRVHGPKCSTAVVKCQFCGDIQQEQLHCGQEMGDQVVGVLIDKSAFKNNAYGQWQGYSIFFRDELCESFVLGAAYDVTGCFEWGEVTAWGVHRPIATQLKNDNLFRRIPDSVKKLIVYLRNTHKDSSWAQTTALSLILGSQLASRNCLLHLRAGLLLSLLSQKLSSQPIHVLCLGVEGLPLMKYCTQLADRSINAWEMVNNPAGASWLDDYSNCVWQEAGPLLMATGGICYLGEWSRYQRSKSSLASQIKHALEHTNVKMEVRGASRLGPCSSSQAYPLKCSIWTNLHEICANKDKVKIRAVIDFFPLPFIGNLSEDEEVDYVKCRLRQVCRKSAENHVTSNENFSVTEDDLIKYLDLVSSYPVTFSEKANTLVRRYFIGARKSRPNCLPVSLIKVMMCMSEAHARIAMRQQVTEEDAMFAVYLCEQSITYIYGPCSNMPLVPLAATLSTTDDSCKYDSIVQQVDNNLLKFSVSISNTLRSLVSDESVANFTEE